MSTTARITPRRHAALAFFLMAVAVCVPATRAQKNPAESRQSTPTRQTTTPAPSAPRVAYTNPVIPGDNPDPSVIRVGQDYWATATAGTWAPIFTLYHSRDLVLWRAVGAVFQKRPAWAERDFWAPEISHFNGRTFVYYTARKRKGPLCVAVASAAQPEGPYIDHGPLVCQDDGSIDAVATTDERGVRYLIWKEDGNSRQQPTPLWAQQLSADGIKLVGAKRELLRNDPKSWEGGVVEGAFVERHGNYFYLFYSGGSCCGRRCDYALGVARARKLLGPWEKHPANPIVAANQSWQCPGHGSIVTDPAGRDFLLYHAYGNFREAFLIGRESVLDEVSWDEQTGWPTINAGRGVSARSLSTEAGAAIVDGDAIPTAREFFDDFNSNVLNPTWHWEQTNEPNINTDASNGGGRLLLLPQIARAKEMLGAVIMQPTFAADYTATALIDLSNTPPAASAVGLAAYDRDDNALGINVSGAGRLRVWQHVKKQRREIATIELGATKSVYLRLTARDATNFRCAYSRDGKVWSDLGPELDGSDLEPVRLALTSGGNAQTAARFAWVRLKAGRSM